jgi:peptide/nickel transport system substrate-binding protein
LTYQQPSATIHVEELVARSLVLAAAVAVSLLAVSGAGGASAQTPKRGGTVVLNQFGSGPPCLNFLDMRCHPPLGTGAARLLVAGNTLLGAFQLRDGRMHPRLVSKVEFTTTPPYTLTYSIRPEARWSDGVPVSARDFVFTYRTFLRYRLPDHSDPHVTMIRSVGAVAPKTVRVVLRSRFAHWRELFDVVLPRHALAGEDLKAIWTDVIDNPKTGQPIASGPFFIISYESGGADRRLVTRRNPRYWGPHPAYLDQVVLWWSGLPQNELIDALRRGKIHRTDLFDPQLVAQARGTRGLRIDVRLAGAWEHFELRLGAGGHPALQNRHVRRALAYGIDRSTIVRELFAHIDSKALPSDSAIYLAEDPAYEPNWRIYRYRPELARRLLVRGGCRLGADGIRFCEQGGGRLSLRFVTRADNPERALTLRLAQAQLLRVGVLVEPIYATQGALFGQILPSGDFDVALFSWGRTTEGMADFYGCAGVSNFTGYCERGLTGELKEADRILDTGRRAELLNRADRQLAADVPVVPLFQPRIAAATAATLSGTRSRSWEDWWLAD